MWVGATAASCEIYIILKLTGARSTRSSLEPCAPKVFILKSPPAWRQTELECIILILCPLNGTAFTKIIITTWATESDHTQPSQLREGKHKPTSKCPRPSYRLSSGQDRSNSVKSRMTLYTWKRHQSPQHLATQALKRGQTQWCRQAKAARIAQHVATTTSYYLMWECCPGQNSSVQQDQLVQRELITSSTAMSWKQKQGVEYRTICNNCIIIYLWPTFLKNSQTHQDDADQDWSYRLPLPNYQYTTPSLFVRQCVACAHGMTRQGMQRKIIGLMRQTNLARNGYEMRWY